MHIPKNAKYFVLDTNVLIHNPHAILSFKDNVVIIPMAVLEELDSLKKGQHEKSRNAREAIRFIGKVKKHGIIEEGVKIENNIILKIELSYALPDKNMDFVTDKMDNKIILTAYKLKKEGKRVFFISKDINARIKAMALGIYAEDYKKEKVDIETLYSGYRELQLSPEEVEILYVKKELPYDKNNLFANEFVGISRENKKTGEKEILLGRYDIETQKISLVKDIEPIWGIKPRNVFQKCAFNILLDDNIQLVTLIGIAGTGKTLLALAAALQKVVEERVYNKILVSRPIVPLGKDIGYLPGKKEEKLSHWMQPIFDNLEYLCSNADNEAFKSYEYLFDANFIELEALTYIRGRSLPRQFMIIDEAQNLTPHEVKTIISRAGEHTKVILTGDPYQIDNPYLDANSNGLSYVVERFKGQKIYGHITLNKSERSFLAELAAKLL